MPPPFFSHFLFGAASLPPLRLRPFFLSGSPTLRRIGIAVEPWNIGLDIEKRGLVEDIDACYFEPVPLPSEESNHGETDAVGTGRVSGSENSVGFVVEKRRAHESKLIRTVEGVEEEDVRKALNVLQSLPVLRKDLDPAPCIGPKRSLDRGFLFMKERRMDKTDRLEHRFSQGCFLSFPLSRPYLHKFQDIGSG